MLQDVVGQAYSGFATPVLDRQGDGDAGLAGGDGYGKHRRAGASKSHGAGAQGSETAAARE